MIRRSGILLAVLASGVGSACLPGKGAAQLAWRDFVVTSGFAVEGYRGNLPTVAAVVRDSTEVAGALVADLSARGEVTYHPSGSGVFLFSFDGAVRQLSAWGFETRDYAPREWVGAVDGSYSRFVSPTTSLSVRTRLRGRDVQDRPPMPLFLQPGSITALVGVGGVHQRSPELQLDLEGTWEVADFAARSDAPQVRLLDRRTFGAEAGATRFLGEASTLRVYGGVSASRYPEQATFLPDDPYRRDRTLHGGIGWTYNREFLAQLGVDGRLNRSNSRRPEYNAVTARILLSASLPAGVTGTAFAAIAAKEYLEPTEFARLIPGEEANNTSTAYISFSRPLARNLNGTVRLGWSRAETEIGDAYFQRGGASFFLSYRPLR